VELINACPSRGLVEINEWARENKRGVKTRGNREVGRAKDTVQT
jgi:hypothetical protein